MTKENHRAAEVFYIPIRKRQLLRNQSRRLFLSLKK